jgi:hypothetical protein
MNPRQTQNTKSRYIEKDGRAYRWDGAHVYALCETGKERIVESDEAIRVQMTGAEISEHRADKIVRIIDELRDDIGDTHSS